MFSGDNKVDIYTVKNTETYIEYPKGEDASVSIDIIKLNITSPCQRPIDFLHVFILIT